jgi:hypothetical protein
MRRKVKKEFLISKYISGELPQSLDEEIERFSAPVHRSHTYSILRNNYKHVHAIMDAPAHDTPGHRHRIHRHNVKFIKRKFKKEQERSAGYIHLLGDFISDILWVVLKIALKDINQNKVLPPQFLIFSDGKPSWDVKEKAIEELTKRFGELFIDTLKNKRNRSLKKK